MQIQQANIECSADTGMKKKGLVTGHCILIVAKGRKAPIKKERPEDLGFGVRDRVIVLVQ